MVKCCIKSYCGALFHYLDVFLISGCGFPVGVLGMVSETFLHCSRRVCTSVMYVFTILMQSVLKPCQLGKGTRFPSAPQLYLFSVCSLPVFTSALWSFHLFHSWLPFSFHWNFLSGSWCYLWIFGPCVTFSPMTVGFLMARLVTGVLISYWHPGFFYFFLNECI